MMKNVILPALAGLMVLGWAAAPAVAYDSETCRSYTRQEFKWGHLELSYGTACRARDGRWLIDGDFRRPLPRGAVYEPGDRIIVTERRPIYVIDRDSRHGHRHDKKKHHKGRDDHHDNHYGHDDRHKADNRGEVYYFQPYREDGRGFFSETHYYYR